MTGEFSRILVIISAATLTINQPASAQDLISDAAEVMVRNGEPLPDPRSNIDYASTDAFDIQLFSSLRQLRSVRVKFVNPTDEYPERVALWATRIEETSGGGRKGKLVTCVVGQSSAFLSELLKILLKSIGDMLLDKVNRAALYSPAKNFDLIAEVDSSTKKMSGVRFVRRADLARVKESYAKCL